MKVLSSSSGTLVSDNRSIMVEYALTSGASVTREVGGMIGWLGRREALGLRRL